MTVQDIITWFTSLAYIMPLEIFVSVGLFLDEIILPTPAPIILTIAGSLAKTQEQSYFFLFILAVGGGVGKMLGMWFYYFLGEKAEHLIVPKYGKMLGVTQKEIDKLSAKFQGGWRDNMFLFVSRVIPFVPTIPVSFICGILRTNLKSFLIVSFVATTIRNYIFLYVGFVGAKYALLDPELAEKITVIGMLVFFVGFSAWYYRRQRKMGENSDIK